MKRSGFMSNIQKKFENLSELFGWLQIAVTFLAIGSGFGLVAACIIGGIAGIIGGTVAGSIIFLIGVYIATKAYKGKGTIHVVSRTMASPELDDTAPDENTK
jgi:hypothetical protein